MKKGNISYLALFLILLTIISSAPAQVIISDDYNITTVNEGFVLGNGGNTGINPPTNRMTGAVAADLRYYQTATARNPSFYDINTSRLRVSQNATIGRF